MNEIEYFERGYEKQVAGQYEEAIKDYNMAIEINKDFIVNFN